MSNRVILVTGAAGYIGSHCCLDLLNSGFKVVAIDNFFNAHRDATGKTNHPESLIRVEKLTGKSIDFYEVDLKNIEDVKSVFQKYETIHGVLHFAAYKAVGESFQRVLEYYENNISSTCNLLLVMKQFKVFNLVFSSSCTVYGNPASLPLDEDHPTGHCTNPYGSTKATVEQMMIELSQSDPSWSFTFLRYFNPIGAHPSGEIGEDPLGIPNNLMPYIAQVAIGRREKLYVYGNDYETPDGTCIRDYIHVMDLSDGHLKAVQHLLQPNRKGVLIYNLGTGEGATVLQVIQAFSQASGKDIPYEIVERRKGDVDSLFASCQKAEKELGWKIKHSLSDMCTDMWKWQSQNPQGFNPVTSEDAKDYKNLTRKESKKWESMIQSLNVE